MAMIKTLRKSRGGCKDIQLYLEGKNVTAEGTHESQRHLGNGQRSLAKDTYNVVDTKNWWQEFDNMRISMGKDEGTKYFHFIIAPDPEDDADLDTVRSLAKDFMKAHFPNAQWVIEYHDDGANGNIHAHIVMNSVDLFTRRKIHISNQELHDLTLHCQQMCMERGLTYFGDENGNPSPDCEVGRKCKKPAAEKPVQESDRSWNDDIRKAVDEAIAKSQTFTDFMLTFRAMGYDAYRNSRGGITFVHPHKFKGTDRHYKVRGTIDNLGEDYTLEGIYRRLPLGFEHQCVGTVPRTVSSPVYFEAFQWEEDLAHYTAAEKRLIERGEHSWKQDIRDAVDEEVKNYTDFDEFAAAMSEKHGIEVTRGNRGVITYVHPDARDDSGKRRTVRGTTNNLGCGYTYEGINIRMNKAHSEHAPDIYKGILYPYVPPPRDLGEMIERRAKRRPWVSAERVEEAVNVVVGNGYKNFKAMKQGAEKLAKRVGELSAELQYEEARVGKLEEGAAKAKRLREINDFQDRHPILPDNLREESWALAGWLIENGFELDDAGFSARVAVEREQDKLAAMRTALDLLTQRLETMNRSLDTMADLSFYTDEHCVDRAKREAQARIANNLDINLAKRYAQVIQLHTDHFSQEIEEERNKIHVLMMEEEIKRSNGRPSRRRAGARSEKPERIVSAPPIEAVPYESERYPRNNASKGIRR